MGKLSIKITSLVDIVLGMSTDNSGAAGKGKGKKKVRKVRMQDICCSNVVNKYPYLGIKNCAYYIGNVKLYIY